MNKEQLEKKIKELTKQLKEIVGNSIEYWDIWNKRADLVLKLYLTPNYYE